MAYEPHARLTRAAASSSEIWRLLVGIVLALVIYITLLWSGMAVLALVAGEERFEFLSHQINSGSTPLGVISQLFMIGLLAIAVVLVTHTLHQRGLASLLGPFRATAHGFFLAALSSGLVVLAVWILPPRSLPIDLEIGRALGPWLVTLPVALLAIIAQCAAEELAFRGYLQQQLAARFDHPAIWMGLPALIFALLHYSVEEAGANAGLIAFWAFAFGLAAADLTARSGTLGPAIGLHVANNATALLLVSVQGNLDGLALYQIPPELKTDLRFAFQERMALAGHGVLFDIEGVRVALTNDEIDPLLDEMLDAVRSEPEGRADLSFELVAALDEIIAETEEAVFGGELQEYDLQLGKSLLIRAMAFKLSDDTQNAYQWRAQYLFNRIVKLNEWPLGQKVYYIDEKIMGWYRLRYDLYTYFSTTPYMRRCRAAGVPVPPNFATSGTAWEKQGVLGFVMETSTLNKDAHVWTWADPSKRGACVALPRGTGGPGDLAGIICQSASTGNACFWDNLPTGSTTRIEWGQKTMVIKDIQDGSNLTQTCPACHKGNNVFLVAPDDNTWCRLMRGGKKGTSKTNCKAITGANTQNFTLAVEGKVNLVPVPNTSVSHSRYTPLSKTPRRTGWDNDMTGMKIGCGYTCHLNLKSQNFRTPRMQPLCGNNCY